MQAEDLVRAGRVDEAVSALLMQIRKDPANAGLRVFLFHLFSVQGKWEDALTQLNIAAELDNGQLLAANIYRSALASEAFREEVFSGRRQPVVFGEPADWIGWLIQANHLCGQGQYKAAAALRDKAFEAAPAVSGSLDGHPFAWMADSDNRLGPVLEAIVDGKYYWVPITAVRRLHLEPPTLLSDVVWVSAHFTWINQGESFGLIPARYPDSINHDAAFRLSRRTEWISMPEQWYYGIGQRMLTTDQDDYPLLEIRKIEFNAGPAD